MKRSIIDTQFAIAQSNGQDFVLLTLISRLTNTLLLHSAVSLACESYSGNITLSWDDLVPEIRYEANEDFDALTLYVVPAAETI